MNRAYWALPGVKGTVWEHYMLVASQWPTVPVPAGPDNDGRFFPGLAVDPDTPRENYQSADAAAESKENLVNTTMETYLQDAPVQLHELPCEGRQRARARLCRHSRRLA